MPSLCIPWRTDHGQRERLWRACVARWTRMLPGWSIYSAGDPSQPFNRSAARNNAVAEATRHDPGWRFVVLADADVTVGHAGQVQGAVVGALETGRLVYAHTWQATLTQAATERVLAGADPTAIPRDDAEWEQRTYSSVYAVPRSLWETVGGFDERYVGWGLEDHAFMLACRVMGGRIGRTDGTVYALHHDRPREEREGNPHYPANHALFERYQAASHSTTAMREVLKR